jgi:hypothetical protein
MMVPRHEPRYDAGGEDTLHKYIDVESSIFRQFLSYDGVVLTGQHPQTATNDLGRPPAGGLV